MKGKRLENKDKNTVNKIENKELLQRLELMIYSRTFDEKVMTLIKQGRADFLISGAGHEAVQIAFGEILKPRFDWAYPYYRDLAFLLALGLKPKDLMLEMLGKADDPANGGRQMPNHWGSKEFNIPSQSSPTGTQFLQAVGTALAFRKKGENRIVYVSAGDGTTSQGEFHEAVNWASREKLPVIFVIQNNKWAISVPVEEQTAGKNASVVEMMKGYENLLRISADGTDYLKMRDVAQEAYDYALAGKGPVLVEAHTVRLFSHSSSDDQKKYRSAESLEEDLSKDPIKIFADYLRETGILTDARLEKIREQAKKEIDEVADWALAQKDPEPESAIRFVLDESGLADTLEYELSEPRGNRIVMVDAINHALKEEMERNPNIYLFGEDVAGDKGGVFSATKDLTKLFGKERVFNSPLAEASIEGVAVGMALAGLKPCVEIQFGDYIWPSMMQIRNEVATMRYRSNGKWSCPIVMRVPVGGYIHGSICHSQSIDGFFTHLPGIYIAYPSNASDAKGLLKMACRMEDPVMFMEHKGLYRQGFAASPEPDENYLLPFGKARIVQEGNDVTIITWGALVQKSIEAARNTGLSVEIIDLRTLNPLDMETILTSLQNTSRVIVAHEDNLNNGFGAEIAARIGDEAFEYLDAPIKRVASKDSPIAYSTILENELLVQTSWIESAIQEIVHY